MKKLLFSLIFSLFTVFSIYSIYSMAAPGWEPSRELVQSILLIILGIIALIIFVGIIIPFIIGNIINKLLPENISLIIGQILIILGSLISLLIFVKFFAIFIGIPILSMGISLNNYKKKSEKNIDKSKNVLKETENNYLTKNIVINDTIKTNEKEKLIINNNSKLLCDYLDKESIEEAQKIGRIYGKNVYTDIIRRKLFEIGLTKDKIDEIINIG